MNRYPFSGKIICSECGGKFKRRIHSKNGGKYVAWCCGKHIDDVTACSMKFIRNADVEKAFVTMMNKLVYGRRFVLRPLLESLREMDQSDSFGMIQELELRMEKNAEQRQILTGLMAKGYLEPALFNKENNELLQEAAELEMQKNGLSHSVNGEMVKTGEVEALLKFAEKGEMLTAFDGELFGRFVEQITVYSRNGIGFQMKCGLTLRERM
ncbi:zinc ribbon domain-containing protein [Blautia massiliensis (ex Durand et al. 2017)]|uniref:zinc ribbon domain-containing protein n=1 Tax=Blautia TaxID=572511 RepID=UPI002ED6A816